MLRPVSDLGRRLAVARGDEPADLVVHGGNVLSSFTREWLHTDVAICDGVIAGVGEYEGRDVLDAAGRFVVPGFIDAHMHLESSLLMPDEFARFVVPLGTTTVVADPHEVANVLGAEGVHWLVDSAEGLPLDIYFKAPSCVPASPFESPRRALGPGDLEGLLRRRRMLGLAEMMNFPGVIGGDPGELAKLEVTGAGRIDGHAPAVTGAPLQAYAGAGIGSDHEATTLEEGLERLRAGMVLFIREASGARNLEALIPLAARFGPHRIALCTDDRDPDHIAADGHVNAMVRDAVRSGVDPLDALVMASLTAATWHGLDDRGAIAAGRRADLLVLEDLERYVPDEVLVAGRPPVWPERAAVPTWALNTVRIDGIEADALAVPAPAGAARVIELIPGQILTREVHERLDVSGGHAVADPTRDLAKLAVVERHLGTRRVGLGFVRGFGLLRGAIASSVAHDAHNVIVAGVDDGDILVAVRRLSELGGGMVAVAGGQVLGELPLPVAGLLSEAPAADVLRQTNGLIGAARSLGSELEGGPFHALSFLALSVIPALKLTDHGLVDVDRFELVPLGL
jgi:adenine deaminase